MPPRAQRGRLLPAPQIEPAAHARAGACARHQGVVHASHGRLCTCMHLEEPMHRRYWAESCARHAPSPACVVLEPLGGSVLTYAVWQGQHGVVREPQGGSALPTRTYGYARCDAAQSTARAGAACASYRACSARACRGVRAAPRRSEKAAIDCCAHAGVTAYAPKLVTGASCKTCTLTRLRGPRTTTRFGAYIGTTAGTVPRVVVEPLTPSPGSLTPHAHLCCTEAK